MTFDNLCRTLPNGLHDAGLVALEVDYDRREAILDVDVDFGGPELDPPEQYSRRRLRFTGLSFLIIDPPVRGPGPSGRPWIDAGNGQPATSPIDLPPLPAGAFLCWIFVCDWNSFIRIAAASAELEPIEH